MSGRRVIASFHDRPAFMLGTGQIILGLCIFAIGCVVFATNAFTSVGGSGLLVAITLLVCGSLGIAASKTKEIWAIMACHIMGIIAFVFCLVLIGAAAQGVGYEEDRDTSYSLSSRIATDIVAIFFALGSAASLVWTLAICSLALYTGCCKPNPGSTYVPETNIDRSRAEFKSSENVTPRAGNLSVGGAIPASGPSVVGSPDAC